MKIDNLIKKPDAPYVYIVGAGPGEPMLLTIKAHYLLSKIADVVVYDRLIPKQILDLIPDNIEKVYAGKSCKKHIMTQDEINKCLCVKAKEGKVVVRLKGGDPFIFGRGGEEAEYLISNNIPFEIVPGVNAADGCAAYRGIPLTHRGVANSVRFITGHQQKGKAVELDWKGLADENTTLVIYMGLTNLKNICNNLIDNGLSKKTPSIIIENGTTNIERSCKTTLDKLESKAYEMEFLPPTLVIIGKVVSLAR